MPPLHDPSALTVNLAAVSARGAKVAVAADAAALGFRGAAFGIVGLLRLGGRIERLEAEGFRLQARLGGALRLECVRCLGSLVLPVEEALDLVFLPQAENAPAREGGERALDDADMNVSFYDGDTLDLSGTVWEQLHLALPVKPLCNEACRGLCPSCGADRNREAPCPCEPAAPTAGALGGLRDLLAAR